MKDLSWLLETDLEDDDDTRRIRPIQRGCLDRALNPQASSRERISRRRDDSFSIGLLVGWSNLKLSFDVPIRILRERPEWFPTFLERIASFPDVLDLLMLVAPDLPWSGEAAVGAIANRRNRHQADAQ